MSIEHIIIFVKAVLFILIIILIFLLLDMWADKVRVKRRKRREYRRNRAEMDDQISSMVSRLIEPEPINLILEKLALYGKYAERIIPDWDLLYERRMRNIFLRLSNGNQNVDVEEIANKWNDFNDHVMSRMSLNGENRFLSDKMDECSRVIQSQIEKIRIHRYFNRSQ